MKIHEGLINTITKVMFASTLLFHIIFMKQVTLLNILFWLEPTFGSAVAATIRW